MVLTLEVIAGEQAASLGDAARKVFRAIGGTIGRLPDNDWVLPDRYISGRHALVRYLNGRYFIEDTSTNGVFVNSPTNRIARQQPHPLADGDILYLDAYQIRVSIGAADGPQTDPFMRLQELWSSRRARSQQKGRKASSAGLDKVAVDLLEDQAVLQGALYGAFRAMLARLDPEQLQKEFEARLRSGSVPGPLCAARSWDMYCERYEEWTKDPQAAFRELFAVEFVRLCEKPSPQPPEK